MPDAADRLIVAIDVPAIEEARTIAEKLKGVVRWFKVGSQLFTRAGPAAVTALKEEGFNVFLDLKFHDIPNTVYHAGLAAAALGADMFNVHASGGPRALRAAADSARESGAGGGRGPIVLAVTVLTSMGADDLAGIGLAGPPGEAVMRLAALARENGLDGVVASPEEAAGIKERFGGEFVVVTPGVRPAWAKKGDQRRVSTPADAIRTGADYLVVGRPILDADDPLGAARKTIDEMERAL